MKYTYIKSFIVLALTCVLVAGCKSEASEQAVASEDKARPSFLIVDLDGDGPDILPLEESQVYFDVDGDGLAERTAWVNTDDALLSSVSWKDRRLDSTFNITVSYLLNTYPQKFLEFDTNNDQVFRDDDYIDLPKGRNYRPLGFIIAKDANFDGIPEMEDKNRLPCKYREFDFSQQIKKLICEERIYEVYKVSFEYEDSNVIWKVMCERLRDGYHHSSGGNKRDYHKYCIEKNVKPKGE